jgi:hypothetical protein
VPAEHHTDVVEAACPDVLLCSSGSSFVGSSSCPENLFHGLMCEQFHGIDIIDSVHLSLHCWHYVC